MTALGPEVADLLDGAPRSRVAAPRSDVASQRITPERQRSAPGEFEDLFDATFDTLTPAARGSTGRAARLRELLATALPPLVAALAVLGAWEAWVRWRAVPDYLAPAPTAVVEALAGDPSRFLEAGAVSLQHALGGLLLGGGAGFALGIAMAHSRVMERALYPLAILVKVTPIVAIAPLVTIWLGFGDQPKYVVAALITFFPLLVGTIAGLRSVDPAALDFFRSLDASRWQRFWRLRLPSALPHLLAALKISIPLALIGAVVAEWMAADSGVGQVIVIAHGDFDTAALFAAVFVLAAIGVALTAAVALAERRLLGWHEARLDS